MAEKKYYPIMLDIENKNCLVIGGGNVAFRKIKALLEHGANISIISRELCLEIQELKLNWISKEYKTEFLEGNFLVIAATDDNELNEKIYQDCQNRNILVNVVDKPEICGFILPAIYKEGDLTISVSTNGKSPMSSKLIRDELKEKYNSDYTDFINLVGKLRILARHKDKIILGTRGSKLALKQAEIVSEELKKYIPSINIEIKIFKTLGEKMPDVPLEEIKEDDVFTREIDEALLKDEIDIAVHSLKDMPQNISEEISLIIFPKAEDPRDVLVSKNNCKLYQLATGSIIGTSSPRREAQLKQIRPDFIFKPIRGNIDERIKKVEEGLYDATILAAAGLKRLGLNEKIVEYFDIDEFPTAHGQGKLAITIKTEKLK